MVEEEFQKIIRMAEGGHNKQAEFLLVEFVKKYPNFTPALLWLGDIFLNAGKIKDALKILRRSVKINPFNGWAKFLFAEALLKANRFYLAREYLEQARDLLPNNVEIYRSLGWAEVMIGNVKKGKSILKEALKMSPNNIYVYTDLAASENMTGNFDQAKEWLSLASKLDANNLIIKNLKRSIQVGRKSFNKFSSSEKKAAKNALKKNKIGILARVNLLLDVLDSDYSQDDIEEVAFELRKLGVSGEINIFKEGNQPQASLIKEYLKIHQRIDQEEKRNKIRFSPISWSKILSDRKRSLREKKKILVLLARQGNKKSLTILRNYLKQPEEKLVEWLKLAIDECWSRIEVKNGKRPVIRIKKI